MSSTKNSSNSTNFSEPIYHELYYPRPRSESNDEPAVSKIEPDLFDFDHDTTIQNASLLKSNTLDVSNVDSPTQYLNFSFDGEAEPVASSSTSYHVDERSNAMLSPSIQSRVTNPDPNFMQYSGTAQFTSLGNTDGLVGLVGGEEEREFTTSIMKSETLSQGNYFQSVIDSSDLISPCQPQATFTDEFHQTPSYCAASDTNPDNNNGSLIDYRTKLRESSDHTNKCKNIEDVYKSWMKEEHDSDNESSTDFDPMNQTPSHRKFIRRRNPSIPLPLSSMSPKPGAELANLTLTSRQTLLPVTVLENQEAFNNAQSYQFKNEIEYHLSDSFNNMKESSHLNHLMKKVPHPTTPEGVGEPFTPDPMQFSIKDMLKDNDYEEKYIPGSCSTTKQSFSKDNSNRLNYRDSIASTSERRNNNVPYQTSQNAALNTVSCSNMLRFQDSSSRRELVDLRTSLLFAKEEARKSGSHVEEEFLDEWMRCLNGEDGPSQNRKYIPDFGSSSTSLNINPSVTSLTNSSRPDSIALPSPRHFSNPPPTPTLSTNNICSPNFPPSRALPIGNDGFINSPCPSNQSFSLETSSRPSSAFDILSPQLIKPTPNFFPEEFISLERPQNFCGDVTAEVVDMSAATGDPQLSEIVRTGLIRVNEPTQKFNSSSSVSTMSPPTSRTGSNKRR